LDFTLIKKIGNLYHKTAFSGQILTIMIHFFDTFMQVLSSLIFGGKFYLPVQWIIHLKKTGEFWG
jgi:hypothetical protein